MNETQRINIEIEQLAIALSHLNRNALIKHLLQYKRTNLELMDELDDRRARLEQYERLVEEYNRGVDKLILERLLAVKL